VSYTITDDNGVEKVETMTDLFDGLIMRGVTAVEALIMISEVVSRDLQEPQDSADLEVEQ
jgi:hypothetical protein